MDEPTEGLAPIIVDQVAAMLRRLAADGEISVLLIEQNLGVATTVASRVAVMVNGRLVREMPAQELAHDHELQQRLLGVRAQDEAEEPVAPAAEAEPPAMVFRVQRAAPEADAPPQAEAVAPPPAVQAARAPTRWSHSNPLAEGEHAAAAPSLAAIGPEADEPAAPRTLPAVPVARLAGRAAYVAGTFDTKGRELNFIRGCLEALGLDVVTVDLSTSRRPSPADVGPAEVARSHPRGARGGVHRRPRQRRRRHGRGLRAVLVTRRDLGGIIAAGGSGATALVTPAMRRSPSACPS
jgi:hypothetical protein